MVNCLLQQEIWIEDPFSDEAFIDVNLIKVLLSVGKCYPNTNIKCKPDLLDLLKFKETQEIQVNHQSCRAIKSGTLEFEIIPADQDFPDTSRIGLCLNLHSLELEIDERALLANLKFIKELKYLKRLRLKDSRNQNGVTKEENNFLGQVFSCGIPSLKKFELADLVSLELNSFPFDFCFPNLTKLCIRNYIGNILQIWIN